MTSNCPYCNKSYIKQCSLEKHILLCDFLNKSKKAKIIDEQEHANMPSYKELVTIVEEMALKMATMEEKIEKMSKWVETKKKKINVIQWLNTNIKPSTSFSEWAPTIEVNQAHLKHLFDNNIIEAVTMIFQESIHQTNGLQIPNPIPIPIYAFEQKSNMFYIFDKEWRELIFTDMTFALKKIQNKLLKELADWRAANIVQITNSDKMSEIYNKNVIKLMNITFTVDQVYNKIKSNLYNIVQVDLKNMIEYEFEF
jgi:hypothetical protein